MDTIQVGMLERVKPESLPITNLDSCCQSGRAQMIGNEDSGAHRDFSMDLERGKNPILVLRIGRDDRNRNCVCDLRQQTEQSDLSCDVNFKEHSPGAQTVSGTINLDPYLLKDNPVAPVGLKWPLVSPAPGSYRVLLKAGDTAGNHSVVRTAEFEVE